MAGPEISPGHIIAGRYRVIEPISIGAWTSIFRCYQEDLDRLVALKIMHHDSVDDPNLVERFRREALFASQLTHPNTITTYDYGKTEDGAFYIVMENLQGSPLGTFIKQNGPLKPERARRALVQICKSLSEVHGLGMIHRDLKPDNVLLCPSNRGNDPNTDLIKVLDFGIAKATRRMDVVDHTLRRITQAGLVVGTPLYMAPEQLLEEDLSFATDIYALGHILYEALTGRAAFEGIGQAMQIMVAHIETAVPELPGPLATHPLNAIIQKAVAKAPAERYTDARELLQALQAIDPHPFLASPSTLASVQIPSMPNVEGQRPAIDLAEAFPAREREIRWLGRQLDLVAADHTSRLVLLTGEPGIGKSRLLDAFVGAVAASHSDIFVLKRRDHASLNIRAGGLWSDLCILLGLETTQRSLEDHLGSALGRYSGIQQAQIPAILRLLNRDPETPSAIAELKDRRQEILAALSYPFLAKARESLVVWVMEDLHTEDALTIAFLEYLRSHPMRDARLLIIATVAIEQVVHGSISARMLRPLLSSSEIQTLRIGGVALDKAHTILADVLDAPPAPALVRALHEPTGGHPGFMVELLRDLYASDRLIRTPEGFALSDDARHTELQIELSSLVQQRILQLAVSSEEGQRAVRLMSTVAMLGQNATLELVHTFLTEIQDEELLTHLEDTIDDALRFGYIERRHDALWFRSPIARYILLHDTVHTAKTFDEDGQSARASLQLAARLIIHRNPDLNPADLQLVVSHLMAANNTQDAIRILRNGADVAYRAFNIETALDFYRQAYQLSQQRMEAAQQLGLSPDTDPEELIVMLRLGELHATLGDLALAEDYLESLRQLADANHTLSLRNIFLGRSLQLLGELAVQRSDLSHATTLLESARHYFETVADDHGVARVIVEFANIHLLGGDARKAIDPLLEAEVLAEVIGASTVQARARLYLARARLQLGDVERAIEDAGTSLALSDDHDNAIGRADALTTLGTALLLGRDFARANRLLGQAAGIRLKIGDRVGLMAVHRLLATAQAADSHVEAARGQLQLEVALAQECRDIDAAAWASLIWSDTFAEVARRNARKHLGHGDKDFADIEAHFDDLDRMARKTRRLRVWARTQIRRAFLQAHRAHPDQAENIILAALDEHATQDAFRIELEAVLAFLRRNLFILEDALKRAQNLQIIEAELLAELLLATLLFRGKRHDDCWSHLSHAYGRALGAGRFVEAVFFNNEIARLAEVLQGGSPSSMSLATFGATPLP